MKEKFRNKYRIASARLQGWDYGWDGAYFVTICTHEMVCILGKVIADENTGEVTVQLSEAGKIADDTWQEIPKHFCFAQLADHVVMPNHIRGIVIIDKSGARTDAIYRVSVRPQDPSQDFPSQNPSSQNPSSQNPSSQDSSAENSSAQNSRTQGGITGRKNPMLHDNLSRAIRWYKGRTTFECRKILRDFAWHSRFNDRVIRDGEEFERIARYISDNPRKWYERRENECGKNEGENEWRE